jgi:rhodanese-related sulfurtransferase
MQQLIEFAQNHYLLVALFFALCGLLLASFIQAAGGIEPAGAVQLINREDATILDTRSAADFAAGHLKDAIHFPLTELPNIGEKLKQYADKPFLVYCASGTLAAQVVRELKAKGMRAQALKGGIAAWRADNLPVTTR